MIVISHKIADKSLNITSILSPGSNDENTSIISNRKKYQNSPTVEHPLKSFHLTNPSLMACRNSFLELFPISFFFLWQKGKKKGVKQLCCYNLGIAKHLYTYNSDAHTLKGVSIRFPLLKCTNWSWRFQVVPQVEANTSFMSLVSMLIVYVILQLFNLLCLFEHDAKIQIFLNKTAQ